MEELSVKGLDENGQCVIPSLTIIRQGFGKLFFEGPLDVSNLNLDEIDDSANLTFAELVFAELDNLFILPNSTHQFGRKPIRQTLVDAVSNCVTGSEDGLGQSGITDWHSRSSDGVSVRRNSIAGVTERSCSETKNLALSTDCRGSSVLGGGEFNSKFRLGSDNLGSVLDWGWKSNNGSYRCYSRLGSGDGYSVIGLSLGDFGCVFNLDGSYQIGNGSDGQVVGEDAEATGVGGVGDTDFLAFWVDVSVAADLVAESVTEVSGGLSGMSITETGLTELVLCVVLGGRDGRIAVSNGVCGSSGDSGVGGADAGVRIISTVVSTIELSLCGNSQHQQKRNLHISKFK
uniref:Uncharacterized protein n=1 Tax=Daphnia galeata TaxID=27404 RepID=A0A8J2RLT1_9CRUS|nr:unnamed protein product [Daphnia galeata]